jgi:predicted nucleic acid-binding protein
MLSLALHQRARFPRDPETDAPIQEPAKRIQFLVDELTKQRATIIIPAPALSEFLVVVHPAGPEYIQTLNRSARFDIQPFDTRAAVEAAEMYRSFIDAGDRRGGSDDDRQKINVDRQIVAIAKVNGAERLYTADRGIILIGDRWGLPCAPVWKLPLPPLDAQPNLLRTLDNEPDGLV